MMTRIAFEHRSYKETKRHLCLNFGDVMNVYGKEGKEIREAFEKHTLKVSVYGLGKMGLPLAAVYADKGAST